MHKLAAVWKGFHEQVERALCFLVLAFTELAYSALCNVLYPLTSTIPISCAHNHSRSYLNTMQTLRIIAILETTQSTESGLETRIQ